MKKSDNKSAYTENELAELKLPGFPCTRKGIKKLLQREKIARQRRDGRGGGFEYCFENLPLKMQLAIQEKKQVETTAPDVSIATEEEDLVIYTEAKNYQKRQADKYCWLLTETKNMTGKEIKSFLQILKAREPNKDIPSFSRFMSVKKKYAEKGLSALLAGYGNRLNNSKITDECFEYFKSLYLKQSKPSIASCWKIVIGRFYKDAQKCPTAKSFVRRLYAEVPASTIFFARQGEKKWSLKFGMYIDRDYSELRAGECWVGDHAQLDIAVFHKGKYLFPWVTAWNDMKSGKWLGWSLHADSPSSDHIFKSFYTAALAFGLPEVVYIDNGKDYRCRDFAGGRKKIRIELDHEKARNALALLNVKAQFALPYNPASKVIERTFLKVKEMFSKHCPGYRGGNVLERPEQLKDEIKAGQVLTFENAKTLFDNFIINVLNKMPSQGKLQGKAPDDVWHSENPVKRIISKDALKLFCSRTSRTAVIGRNGVRDSEFQVVYWDEWMYSFKGRKVYLRRDTDDFNEAWVFDAQTDEYLGQAFLFKSIPALANNAIDKHLIKDALAAKRREIKLHKTLLRPAVPSSVESRIIDMTRSAEALNKNHVTEQNQPVVLQVTSMDRAVFEKRRDEEKENSNIHDYAANCRLRAKQRELEKLQSTFPRFPREKERIDKQIVRLEREINMLMKAAQTESVEATTNAV